MDASAQELKPPTQWSKVGRKTTGVLCFLLGLSLCILHSPLLRPVSHSDASGGEEEMRVTSPDGLLDAVMVREMRGGAVGGIDWRVFIVRKGNPVPDNWRSVVFRSDKLNGEKLVWRQPHLLEIHYDFADINHFHNLWALDQIEDVGPTGEHDYFVEVRLAPSSPDFSYLTPNGDFIQVH